MKKNFLWSMLAFLMAATISVGSSSCEGDDDPELSVNKTSINLKADGDGAKDIVVTANHTDWTATVTNGSPWLRVEKSQNIAYVSVDANNTTQARKGTIRIAATANANLSYDIEVSQEAADYISVNGQNSTSLTFDAYGGISYKQTVSTNSNVGWKIQNVPEWLSVSPTNGNGAISIDIYPRGSNDLNDVSRTATLKLIATDSPNDVSATIEVEQYSDLDAQAYVKPTNIITLYNGIAFDYDFGKNVSYYYRGYMEKSAVASMTESEIISVLEENFARYTKADDEVADFSGLDEGKDYMVYTIGYNKDGKRGKLTKTEIKTKTQQSNEPMAYIDDPMTDGSYWYWSVEKNATCYSYYMITTGDADFALSSDVFQAWMIDYYIRQGWTSEYVNGGDWYQQKSGSLIAIITWGLDKKENFASRIDWNYGVDSNSAPNRLQKRSKNIKADKNHKKFGKEKLTINKRK